MEIVYNMRMRIEKVIKDLEETRDLVDFIGNEGEINKRLKAELFERINRGIFILLSDDDLLNELELCENKMDVLKILERDGIVKYTRLRSDKSGTTPGQEGKSSPGSVNNTTPGKKDKVENKKNEGPVIN